MLATGKAPTEAAPGTGQWVHLSVDSMDPAPNAAAVGQAGSKVGQALQSNTYNALGGFPNDDEVLRSLFTASNNNTRKVALDQAGKLYDPAQAHCRGWMREMSTVSSHSGP